MVFAFYGAMMTKGSWGSRRRWLQKMTMIVVKIITQNDMLMMMAMTIKKLIVRSKKPVTARCHSFMAPLLAERKWSLSSLRKELYKTTERKVLGTLTRVGITKWEGAKRQQTRTFFSVKKKCYFRLSAWHTRALIMSASYLPSCTIYSLHYYHCDVATCDCQLHPLNLK